MPATRPRASFEPIAPDFDLKALVESTSNFSYVDRISCDMIDQQGLPAFEKLILLHVIIGGKPLVIDGYEDRLDPWTFTPQWLRDNCGDKHENARNLTSKEYLPLTMAHYLKNMGMLTNQFFSKPGAYREQKRQRVYLKDIDCPPVWQDKLKDHIPSMLYYLNESTGDYGGPGALPDPNSNVSGRRLGKGIGRAGDLMSSLPPDMRADNLMCYIGHEGTYTPAHREMCASLGHNIMVEASGTVSADDGKPEKPGSSIWFMTESKDRHTVSEYWLSVLGHDIEVENHFAQVVAWKKAPFNVYVVEQRPGDFILIPPLAPHQVWNRGTRTMKVAWNRTTVETLQMALNEALPRSRIVCRDEQYKNKAIIYYTLQKYSSLLTLAQKEATLLSANAAQQFLSSPKIKQVAKDFKRLFDLYQQVLLSEMFNPDDTPKGMEYIPFDSNITCAYCRGNIFNRFLTCSSCKDMLGHHSGDGEGDPYDVCLDCYAMGRSCACISHLKWVEQFRWKELASKYESWRKLIISLDGGRVTEKTPQPIPEEKKKYGKKTLAEVCKEQLKRRPWKDVRKSVDEDKEDDQEEEEEEVITVDDNGMVKMVQKKRSKAWLKNNSPCHVCCHRHPNWKMAQCTSCERWWCYGTLFRGWDKMPIEIMQDEKWTCPHCLGVCFAGACKREGKMTPYEPRGTLLGHDTRKVADARSVEALVDFSVSNLNWLKDDDPVNRVESRRLRKANEDARKAKEIDPSLEVQDEDGGVEFEEGSPESTPVAGTIDPILGGHADGITSGYGDDDSFARSLQQANQTMQRSASAVVGANGSAPDGYAPITHGGYVPVANMYPQPDERGGYSYPGYLQSATGDDEGLGGPELRPFKRRHMEDEDGEFGEEGISMTKHLKTKKQKLTAAGFRSSDLATTYTPAAGANKTEAQKQFEREKERQAIEKAKAEGRFIMLQAALKGKRRIVRLSVPPQRLQQMLAQQAARAALNAGEETDAEHEVEVAAAQQLEGELENEADIFQLKSDIPPKKKQDPKVTYQQKVQEGFVISGANKKAMIPVEKDESYGYRFSKPKGKLAKERMEKQKKRRSKYPANVEYEEVDIGSDEDDDRADLSVSAAVTFGFTAKESRGLPSYLQSRHAKDASLPDELPADFRDRDPSQKSRTPKKIMNPSSATTVPKAQTMVARPSTAGKRPRMRPSLAATGAMPVEDDDEIQPMTGDTTMQDFTNKDGIGTGDQPRPRPSFTSVNRPPVNGTSLRHEKSGIHTTPSAHSVLNQQKVDEDNRLAKLQALEMVTTETPVASKGPRQTMAKVSKVAVSMAEALSDDSDGIEEVPARRTMRAYG